MAVDDPFKNVGTKEYTGHKKAVHSLSWNCAGRKLASAGADNNVRVWNVEYQGHHNRDSEAELRGHTSSIQQVVWDPRSTDHLATASGDHTVRLWDTRSGKSTASVNTNADNLNLTWSPDANLIAVGTEEDALILIDARKGRQLKTIKYSFEINEFEWTRSGDFLLVTTFQGIMILRSPSLEIVRVIFLPSGNYSISVDHTGKRAATGGADAMVHVWDMSEMVCIKTRPFGHFEYPIRSVKYSHDARYIAAGGEDRCVDIADAETLESVHLIPSKQVINTLAWNPKYPLLAYAGDETDTGYSERHTGIVRVFGFPSSSSS
eukprot:jgi/Chlat1/3121/Chrsp21S03352